MANITTLYRKNENDMHHLKAFRQVYLAGIEAGKAAKIEEIKNVLNIDLRR